MRRFVAQLNGGEYMNIPADSMEVIDSMVYAYRDGKLVALVELTAVITAHLSEKAPQPAK